MHMYAILQTVRQRRCSGNAARPIQEGSEGMDGMTNAEWDAFLETLAQLVEAVAKDGKEAAEIIRDKKTK